MHVGETKGAVTAADDSIADLFTCIPVLRQFSPKTCHTQPRSPGSAEAAGGAGGCSGVRGGLWGGDEGAKALGTSCRVTRGANRREGCSGRGSGPRKHPLLHGWKEKRDKKQEGVKRQGLIAGYSPWSCFCSKDNSQMTHG